MTQAEAPREAALRRAAWQRFRHSFAALGRVVQVQIALGAIGLPALVADHAQRYYTSDDLVARIVRVDLLLVLLLGLLLARLGPGLFLRAPDEMFLATTPLSGGARFRYRAWQLALLAVPAIWLGTGGVLPLLWNGDTGLFALGLALWLAWAAFAWAFCATIAGLAPVPGRGQSLFETVAGALPALLLFGARLLTGVFMQLERRESLLVTAAIGAVLAWALARGASRWTWLHERRERTLEAMRGRADALRSTRARPARRKALPRWPRGPWALVARDLRVATRSPRVGGPWLGALLMKGLAFASVLAPGAVQAGRPWALAGACLLLGDALLGAAVIAQMEHERPHLFFGAPLSHARRWWGEALPALLVSALSALALAAVAWAAPDGGAMTARFILAWCLLAGLSLVVTAANLALASFPETGVAQNLFWAGLLVCLILSAVIPLFGWVVLIAFALYSFRQLRHWGPLVLLLIAGTAFAGGEVARDTLRVERGPARAQPRFVQVTSVGDSTWVLSAGTANVVACLTDAGWVLVDTGTRMEAAAIREEVRRLAQRPFALVIDTHFHDDHAGGNALYVGMGVPVLATMATQALVKERVARIRAGAPKEIARLEAYAQTLGPEEDRARGFLLFFADWWREALDDVNRDAHGVALPTESFKGPVLRRVVGGTPIEIRTLKGRAHTGGDCVVFFPDRKVAACGDVFAKGSAPWADQFMGDGSIEGVLAAQDSLLGWLPADTTWALVPGHGPVAHKGDLARDRKALGTARACVRQAWQAGRKAPAIAEDCAGAGFDASQGDYASWLFLEEWNRGKTRGKVH